MTPEQITADLPSLGLEEVYGALTYYLHNRAQVDDYLRRLNDFVEEQVRAEATRQLPAADRVRARLAAKQRA